MWLSLWFFVFGCVEILRSVSIQFSSILKILGQHLSKYFCHHLSPLETSFTYVRPLKIVPQFTDSLYVFKIFFSYVCFILEISIGVTSSSLMFSLATSNLSLIYPVYFYSDIVIFISRSRIWVFLCISCLCLTF